MAKTAEYIAGIDEAGRGPLAGPVVAALVILDPDKPILDLNDSKKLSSKKRENLSLEIHDRALCVLVQEISPQEIDQKNILQATLEAMKLVTLVCLKKFNLKKILLDGNQVIKNFDQVSQEAIISGDSKIPEIMAASIIAKVHRDKIMTKYDQVYPSYGFAQHKGYGTKLHMQALQKFGPCPIHRLSFAPCRVK